MPRRKEKAPLATAPLRETDPLSTLIFSPDSKSPNEGQTHAGGQLIDRFSKPRAESILRNWSPAAIKAMGIRRVPEGGAE
jgi:hypothetical protein